MNPDAEMVERLVNYDLGDGELSGYATVKIGEIMCEAAELIESQSSRIAELEQHGISPTQVRDFNELCRTINELKRDLAAAREALERIARSDYRGNMPSEVAMARAYLDAARNAGKGE